MRRRRRRRTINTGEYLFIWLIFISLYALIMWLGSKIIDVIPLLMENYAFPFLGSVSTISLTLGLRHTGDDIKDIPPVGCATLLLIPSFILSLMVGFMATLGIFLSITLGYSLGVHVKKKMVVVRNQMQWFTQNTTSPYNSYSTSLWTVDALFTQISRLYPIEVKRVQADDLVCISVNRIREMVYSSNSKVASWLIFFRLLATELAALLIDIVLAHLKWR